MSNWSELYQASFPDNADLVASRDTPGWVRGFFRSEGGINGHAEFSKVDLRGPAVIVAAIGLAAGVLGTIAVARSAPHIKRGAADRANPTIRAAWRRVTRQDEAVDHDATADTAMLSKTALEDLATKTDVALEASRSSMSSADAQRHLLEILIAALIIADRMRTLSNARVEDDADLPELKAAMDKLTTAHVTDAINRMLATNTSLLVEETAVIFATIFGGGHVVDGDYVPLRRDKIREALSLGRRT